MNQNKRVMNNHSVSKGQYQQLQPQQQQSVNLFNIYLPSRKKTYLFVLFQRKNSLNRILSELNELASLFGDDDTVIQWNLSTNKTIIMTTPDIISIKDAKIRVMEIIKNTDCEMEKLKKEAE